VSRIGRLPVQVPSGVTVDLKGTMVTVKGPKGELHRTFSELIGSPRIRSAGHHAIRPAGGTSLHGTTRALLANMVRGVSRIWRSS
jgi:large subunit ribosomal protein L6